MSALLEQIVDDAIDTLSVRGESNPDVETAVAASVAALESDPDVSASDKETVKKATTDATNALKSSSSQQDSKKEDGKQDGKKEGRKKGSKKEDSKEKEEDQENNPHLVFLMTFLSIFSQHLKTEKDPSKTQPNQDAQPSWATIMVELAKQFLATQNSTNMVTGKGDVLRGALNEGALSKQGLQQTKNPTADTLNAYFQSLIPTVNIPSRYTAFYTGSTITRRMADGSPSPYTAYYTPDGNLRITGNFKEGFKDVVGHYKAAGLKATNITGVPLSASDAYEVIKTGTDIGFTPILADKGILGTAALFAEEGAKTNPDGNEADTKNYLNQIADNKELRGALVDEMARSGLGEKADLDKMDSQALADKAFEHVKPKTEATAEAAAGTEIATEAKPEVVAAAKPEIIAEAKVEAKPMPAADHDLDNGPDLDDESDLDDKSDLVTASQPTNPRGDTSMIAASVAMNEARTDKAQADEKRISLPGSGSSSKKDEEDDNSTPRLGGGI